MGGLVEREEGFLKSKDSSKISNCISPTVCWPCCSSVQQEAYSSMVQHKQVFCKCLENLTFLCVNLKYTAAVVLEQGGLQCGVPVE